MKLTRTSILIALAVLAGCGSDKGKSDRSVTTPGSIGFPNPNPNPGGPPATGPTPLPASVNLTDLGAPPGGLPATSDLTVFDGKLWMVQADSPLQTFGAQVWVYDDAAGGSFTRVLDDPTSQGYLRARVFGGKLYVPDGDPNGLAPGIVWIFDDASSAPTPTTVDANVHAFDVVELNGALYVSGGDDTGASSLSRFDAASGRWLPFSQGPFSRLKYLGVLDGAIIASKRNTGATQADLVRVDTAGQQTALSLVNGAEALTVCVEAIRGGLYMTLSSNQGVLHVKVEPGGAVTQLTGISGALLFDYVEHSDGNLYAVGSDLAGASFVYGSSDGVDFTRLADVSDLRFGRVGTNADGRPSIGSYNGELYCASSTNGKLYRVD